METKKGGVKRMGLRPGDVNALVRAMRGGASWDEAKALLPRVDAGVLEGFREHVKAEVAKEPPVEFNPAMSADEGAELRAELDLAHSQLAEAMKERDEAQDRAGKLNGDLNDLREENAKLKAEIESLLLDEKPTPKKK